MVDQVHKLSKEFTACAGLVSEGSANAISGMAAMLGREITVTSLRVAQIPVGEAAGLVGGYEALSVGVYLGVTGSATGHMFMIYRSIREFRTRTRMEDFRRRKQRHFLRCTGN